MMASAHPSTWLDAARAELHVPSPGTDGWRYLVPQVDVVDGPDGQPVLVWRMDHGGPRVTPSGRILELFARLPLKTGAAFEAAVLDFARQFGVLRICRHGKPFSHSGGCYHLSPVFGWQGWPHIEPLEAWRRYSAQVRAILAVAGRLQAGVPGDAQDWCDIRAGDPPRWPAPPGEEPTDAEGYELHRQAEDDFSATHPDFTGAATEPLWAQKSSIASAAQTWLRYGRVELAPFWLSDEDLMRSHHAVDGLAGALGAFLLAALQGPLYVCAGCGTTTILEEGRQRRPRAGARFWCSSCGRPEQKRAAARQHYRARIATQAGPPPLHGP